MNLTIKEAIDIIQFAGIEIIKESVDDYETELTIFEKNGRKYVYFSEYPEEGAMELG